MKKITLMCMLLLVGVVTAVAQQKVIATIGEKLTSVNQIQEGQAYMLKNIRGNNNDCYMFQPSEGTALKTNGKDVVYEATGTNLAFYFVGGTISGEEKTGVKIKHGDKFIPSAANSIDVTLVEETSATTFKVKKHSQGNSTFEFVNETSGMGNSLDSQGKNYNLCYWYAGTNNTKWEIYPITLASTYHPELSTFTQVSTTAPTTGKYYLIQFQRPMSNDIQNMCDRRAITSEKATVGTDGTATADQEIFTGTPGRDILPQIWKLESAENNGYYIVSANTGLSWGNFTSLNNKDARVFLKKENNERGVYTFPQPSDKASQHTYNIKNSGFFLNWRDGASTDETLFKLGTWNHGNTTVDTESDAGCQMLFYEVQKIPLAIDRRACYASVCLPFAVTVPEDVTAYMVSQVDETRMILTDAPKTVPANQGVILYKQHGGDILLPLATEATAEADNAWSGNKLSGSLAAREGFTDGSNYVLSATKSGDPTDQPVAFRRLNGTKMPANKAYIASNDETSLSTTLFFDFKPTGITNILNEDHTPKAYYDLQGRRVLFPSHGIFVTDKGEKVLFQ